MDDKLLFVSVQQVIDWIGEKDNEDVCGGRTPVRDDDGDLDIDFDELRDFAIKNECYKGIEESKKNT